MGAVTDVVVPVSATWRKPPRRLAGGCPTPPGRRDVTERRILQPTCHGKAQLRDLGVAECGFP